MWWSLNSANRLTAWCTNMLAHTWMTDVTAAMQKVLSVAEANKELIRADPLQRLHTMHNLAEQMSRGQLPPGIARTLRDSTLTKEGAEIRDHYLAETAAKSAAATHDYQALLKAMADVQKQAVEGDYSLKGALSFLGLRAPTSVMCAAPALQREIPGNDNPMMFCPMHRLDAAMVGSHSWDMSLPTVGAADFLGCVGWYCSMGTIQPGDDTVMSLSCVHMIGAVIARNHFCQVPTEHEYPSRLALMLLTCQAV